MGRASPAGRILIVNTADHGGGAEVVARAALDGFELRGSRTRMLVGVKRTDDPRVIPIGASPHVPARPRAMRGAWELRRRVEREAGLEDFAHLSTRDLLGAVGFAPDVVLLGNLHGGYFDLTRLPALTAAVPVVARLADSWLVTGHCAAPPGCERWERGCGKCPDLALPPSVARDATALNWRRKARILARSRLAVTAPSAWMLDRARRSLLAPAIVRERVVANGVDLETFRPGDSIAGRSRLGIDAKSDVALFVANGGEHNPYKDFEAILAGARIAARERPVELLVVGGDRAWESRERALRVRRIPYIRDPAQLAELMRASDAYVHAAPDETFCLSALEALACGLPVVAAAGGGIGEVVTDGRTGLLRGHGDAAGLGAALTRLLGDRRLRARLGCAAAADAARRFDRERMLDELHTLCIEAADGPPGGGTVPG